MSMIMTAVCQSVNPLTEENQTFYFDKNHLMMKGWCKWIEQIT